MARVNAIQQAMDDPTRKDYGMRLGYGNGRMLNVRAGTRIMELFPDGVKPQVSQQDGVWQIALLNRATGTPTRKQRTTSGAEFFELSTSAVDGDFKKLPKFGACSPADVIKVRGGLLITLPDQLPPVANRSKRGTGKVKTVSRAKPEQTTSSATPSPAPAITGVEPTPKPDTDGGVLLPNISLREAVLAVNAYKRAMPDKVALSVKAETGTLHAIAEYE